jgi:hypothetical protein
VQQLQQQRPQSADEHRGIAVHPPDRPIFGEPAWAGTADLRLPLAALCTRDMLEDLAGQPRPQLRAPRLSAANQHVLILRHTAMSEER